MFKQNTVFVNLRLEGFPAPNGARSWAETAQRTLAAGTAAGHPHIAKATMVIWLVAHYRAGPPSSVEICEFAVERADLEAWVVGAALTLVDLKGPAPADIAALPRKRHPIWQLVQNASFGPYDAPPANFISVQNALRLLGVFGSSGGGPQGNASKMKQALPATYDKTAKEALVPNQKFAGRGTLWCKVPDLEHAFAAQFPV